tara:strand:- start:282 stop:1094 length:813 start_codon:yes stop_codon:yes gene_type:complete
MSNPTTQEQSAYSDNGALPAVFRPSTLLSRPSGGPRSRFLFQDGRNQVCLQRDIPGDLEPAFTKGRINRDSEEFWIVISGAYQVAIGTYSPFRATHGDIVLCPAGMPQLISALEPSARFVSTGCDESTREITQETGSDPLPDQETYKNRFLSENSFLSELSKRARRHTIIVTDKNRMSIIRESPGTTSKPHRHDDFDEWWYIAQGELSFAVGEKSIKIQACEGDIVFVPRGSQHSITTVNGDDSLRLPVTAVGDFHINTNGDDLAPSPRT